MINSNKKFLFVCGCPRSGTSALTDYLTMHHKGVFAIFMERYSDYFKTYLKFPEKAFSRERLMNILPGDTFYQDIKIFQTNIHALENINNAIFIGDKIPLLWKNLKGVFEQFSDAKIFFLFRDIFSVANSYKKRALNKEDKFWGSHRDVFFALNEWQKSIKSLVNFFNSDKDPYKKVYIMEYDKFSTNSFIKRDLCHFLETKIDFSDVNVKYTQSLTANGIILNNIEKRAITDLIDWALVKELNNIINNQRKIYYNNAIKSIKRYDVYHTFDKNLVGADYGEFTIKDCPYVFRGRKKGISKRYVACIGSATTFGRFIKKPYPELLEDFFQYNSVDISFVNLGIGAVRPSTYLSCPNLLNFLKEASLVILEIMGARGYVCPVWEPNLSPIQNVGRYKDAFNINNLLIKDNKLSIIKKENVFFLIGLRFYYNT